MPIPKARRSSSSTAVRASVLADRSQFFKDLTIPFYSYNFHGAKVSEGIRDAFWLQGMQSGIKAAIDCFKQFTETDFTEDLKKIDVPTLVAHGAYDQIVPISNSALLSAKIVPNAKLKIYPNGSHGLAQTQSDEFNADLLAFIKDPQGGQGGQR